MEPTTIFMWTAGAAATITSALAIRAAWTQYNAAIADANTLRFQLERAHTLVDQMTDQVASMNRTIGELRSELKTAKAKQAVADIDALAAKTKTVATEPSTLNSTLRFRPSSSKEYSLRFVSKDVKEWAEVLPDVLKKKIMEAKHGDKYVHSHGSRRGHYVRIGYRGVRYDTGSFGSRSRAKTWLELLRTQILLQRDFGVGADV